VPAAPLNLFVRPSDVTTYRNLTEDTQMTDNNLAENMSFLLDAIVAVDEPDKETLEVALMLTQLSWNNAIQRNYPKINSYKIQLGELQARNPSIWTQLIRNNASSLIKILTQRKEVFYPDDKRLVRKSFINTLGTITVTEDNDDETLHVQGRL